MIVRRSVAFLIDWCVIAVWGSALFGIVVGLSAGVPEGPGSPWQGQAVGLVTMTIPVLLYFALMEAGPWRGTLGKRVMRLRVQCVDGGAPDFGRTLLRNAIKFLPWECGHLVAQQAFHAGESSLPTWVWAFAAVAFLGPVVWLIGIARTGVAAYDGWSGLRVRTVAQ